MMHDDFLKSRHEKYTKRVLTSFEGETAETISSLIIEEAPPSPFLTKKQQKEKIRHESSRILLQLFHTFDNGVAKLLDGAKEYKKHNREVDMKGFSEELLKMIRFFSKVKEKEYIKKWVKNFEEGKEYCEMIPLKEETIELLYQAAKLLYEKEAYQDAKDAFSTLIVLQSKNSNFWIGLAHSTFFLEDYKEACFFYSIASIFAPQDPQTHYFCAQCYEKDKDIPHAVNAIELALLAAEEERYKHLKKPLLQEKNRLQNML